MPSSSSRSRSTASVTGARLGIPAKLVPQQTSDASGTKWSSPNGTIHIQLSRRKEANPTTAKLAEREKKEPKPEPPVDPNVREVKDRLQRALGLKVSIEDKNGRGRVIIEYARLEDFDTLLEQLAGK